MKRIIKKILKVLDKMNKPDVNPVKSTKTEQKFPALYYVETIDSPYNLRKLIDAYMYTKQDYVHEDFTVYYDQLYAGLSKLFDISLDEEIEPTCRESFRKATLRRYFLHTIKSYLHEKNTPYKYLESSLTVSTIRKQDNGKEILDIAREIGELKTESFQKQKELVAQVFYAIYGKREEEFTSQDLLEVGVDDTKQPQTSDYYDFF